ncbi:hypothetical protein PSTG_18639 [Puccinia striiformis f. sp. tritici PST-78]|uniref:Uncharacterized protein n=1 Tax=Puccinia striiformis f. sp. tritici PST-78 TaxID=1165861 RepID=A0A0L0ULP1_9BASI|nr:hypothetical protein PSTG_18639 [Puccinia striiformis f. sp. tritici PST-78]
MKEEERTSEDIMSSDNESEHSSNNPDENVEEEAQGECVDNNAASSPARVDEIKAEGLACIGR